MKSKRQEKATCWNKVRYLNLVSANYAANTNTVKYKQKYWPYRCKICNKWHLTTHDRSDNTIVGDRSSNEEIELTEYDFIEVNEINSDGEIVLTEKDFIEVINVRLEKNGRRKKRRKKY